MKILYVITGLGLGGAEKVVCDIADQMNILGHHVKIAYLTGNVLVKPKAPKIITRTIPGAFIGALIGPGGKVIQELQKEAK